MSLIPYVQELSGNKQYKLPQDWLISHHGLKRVEKINWMEFLLLPYRGSSKNEWTARNTKVHKGLVMEIMQVIQMGISA